MQLYITQNQKQSKTKIQSYLETWEKQRYINLIRHDAKGREKLRYEIGLRAFHEIGYRNITKFVAKVHHRMNVNEQIEGFEYTNEIVEKWLFDTIGDEEKEKKEKKEKKPETVVKRKSTRRKQNEEDDYEDDEFHVC